MAEQPRRLIRLAEVMRRVDLRKTAIYDRIAKGEFPAPVSLGTSSRWVESEVDEWIAKLIDVRDKAA